MYTMYTKTLPRIIIIAIILQAHIFQTTNTHLNSIVDLVPIGFSQLYRYTMEDYPNIEIRLIAFKQTSGNQASNSSISKNAKLVFVLLPKGSKSQKYVGLDIDWTLDNKPIVQQYATSSLLDSVLGFIKLQTSDISVNEFPTDYLNDFLKHPASVCILEGLNNKNVTNQNQNTQNINNAMINQTAAKNNVNNSMFDRYITGQNTASSNVKPYYTDTRAGSSNPSGAIINNGMQNTGGFIVNGGSNAPMGGLVLNGQNGSSNTINGNGTVNNNGSSNAFLVSNGTNNVVNNRNSGVPTSGGANMINLNGENIDLNLLQQLNLSPEVLRAYGIDPNIIQMLKSGSLNVNQTTNNQISNQTTGSKNALSGQENLSIADLSNLLYKSNGTISTSNKINNTQFPIGVNTQTGNTGNQGSIIMLTGGGLNNVNSGNFNGNTGGVTISNNALVNNTGRSAAIVSQPVTSTGKMINQSFNSLIASDNGNIQNRIQPNQTILTQQQIISLLYQNSENLGRLLDSRAITYQNLLTVLRSDRNLIAFLYQNNHLTNSMLLKLSELDPNFGSYALSTIANGGSAANTNNSQGFTQQQNTNMINTNQNRNQTQTNTIPLDLSPNLNTLSISNQTQPNTSNKAFTNGQVLTNNSGVDDIDSLINRLRQTQTVSSTNNNQTSSPVLTNVSGTNPNISGTNSGLNKSSVGQVITSNDSQQNSGATIVNGQTIPKPQQTLEIKYGDKPTNSDNIDDLLSLQDDIIFNNPRKN